MLGSEFIIWYFDGESYSFESRQIIYPAILGVHGTPSEDELTDYIYKQFEKESSIKIQTYSEDSPREDPKFNGLEMISLKM